jgi:AraC-like DNA-binding protein
MEQVIEKEVNVSHVAVQLATVQWGYAEQVLPPDFGYSICQRLSDNHSALRVGNFVVNEAFPRVRSVGFMPPGCAIQLYPVDSPFRALNCVFDKAFFEDTTEMTREVWDEHTAALVPIKNRRVDMLMQDIYSELIQPGFAHVLLIEAACTMILVEMGRYGRRLCEDNQPGCGGQSMAPWRMRRIRERIAASPEIGYPSLADLARLCSISQSHLMRTFKASTGWPIHKYVSEERLKAAKQLLLQDQLTTNQISAKLGFRSPAYFATAFRRMTGKTPTEYRRETRAVEIGRA